VRRTEIAVVGAPPTETLRLELNARPGEDGLVLEFLHDERQTGTLARVIGGRIGLGEVSVPVAVKLQRDIALSQEDRSSVAAKFDKERNVHRRLQSSAEGGGQDRIVRELEVWSRGGESEADSLGPCILCARAAHGLAPRCPECKDVTAVLEEVELTDDHGLRCPKCQRQFWSTPKTRDAILDATVHRDPACHGCALQNDSNTDGCRSSVVFLNFFRNRLLLLDRLDLDLEDYFRWQRNGAASQSRPAAWQAFTEHRRLVQERRDRLYVPPVGKVADLLQAADLFSEAVAAVEHLHHHGVAHLDIKPANVCLRFRGPDLEVKVIDLGLSDDPNTLTYLRQAEGPLSLWTDYSAPEFRRPRTRPIEVSGRFREDGCEVLWPAAEAVETPCPGDILFFSDRDLRRQRYRVVSVQPESEGRLLIQARNEPDYRPWLGEPSLLPAFGPEAWTRTALTVVLERHCGCPADVFSLGMLLLAVLAANPDVADFREALPGIQIELEERAPAHSSLPGRALVHSLLVQPSKHLQVFRAYAQRLDAFGAARPLAEELLGLVLRATLRGDSGVYYLPHRGGDAMRAMRQLRSDLDAIRGALRNTLSAAQAVAVREARLSVLDQFRGRLDGRSADPALSPLTASGGVAYAGLDLGMAGETYRRAELAYLPTERQPGAIFDRWQRELIGIADNRVAQRNWDFIAHYCRRLDLSSSPTRSFLNHFQELAEKVTRATPAAGALRADDREHLLLWVDEFRPLADRLEEGNRFLTVLQEFREALKDRLLKPWDRSLREKRLVVFRRRAVRVVLSRLERVAVPDEKLLLALDRLEETVRKSVAARNRRAVDFDQALARWRAFCAGQSWLGSLAELEAEATRQREQLRLACAGWDRGCTAERDCLRCFSTRAHQVLAAFDALLAVKTTSEEVSVRLTRHEREAIAWEESEAAGTWLSENWPDPGDRVEAQFALWDLGVSVGG
jgi:hypothetical protein